MSAFVLYIIGFTVLTIGLVLAANLANVPPRWIAVGAVVLMGLGIVMGVSRTRQKDRPQT